MKLLFAWCLISGLCTVCAARGSIFTACLFSGGLFYSVVATRHQPIGV